LKNDWPVEKESRLVLSRPIAFVTLLTGLCAGSLPAQIPASTQASGPTKIATINLNVALAGTKDGKRADSDIQAKLARRRSEIQDQQKEIARLAGELQKPDAAVPEDKRIQMEQELRGRQKKLDRDKRDAQEEVQRERQSFTQNTGPKFVAVIEKYARDHSYELVLDTSTSSPVIYGATEDNITAAVIAAYDAR
jgi:Skp family chaperone for outer membrane proteins